MDQQIDQKVELQDQNTDQLKEENKNQNSETTNIIRQSTDLLSYTMESNLFNYQELLESDSFAIKRYKDSHYKGDLQNRKRHGNGVIIYKNGRVYEGQWVDDKRDGNGYERYTNGAVYQGTYSEGKPHGRGLFTWPNGESYDGQFHNGLKEGYGIWQGIHGDSYIGQWKDSKADGVGVHKWKNGDKYEGEWRACLRHGNGTDTFANGDNYVGQYRYGNPNGFGQYTWTNGNIYAGEFQDGLKHGKGKWKKKCSDDQPFNNNFEGEYQNDMKNGYGEFQWISGNKYKGNYINDYRQGYGEMYWVDGSIYKGYWDKGIQNGLGIMIFSDGFKRAGFFSNNIYKENLESLEQLNNYIKSEQINKFPEILNQELKEYLGIYDQNSEYDEIYINQEFKEAEQEDPPEETQFKAMQEVLQYGNNEKGDSFDRQQYAKIIEAQDLIIEANLQSQLPVSSLQQEENKGFQFPTLTQKVSPLQSDFRTSRYDKGNKKELWQYFDNPASIDLNMTSNSKLTYNDFQFVRKINEVSNNYKSSFKVPKQKFYSPTNLSHTEEQITENVYEDKLQINRNGKQFKSQKRSVQNAYQKLDGPRLPNIYKAIKPKSLATS